MYVELCPRCTISMDIIYHLEHTFTDKIVCPEQTPHGFLILCTMCDIHDKNKQKMLQNTHEAFFTATSSVILSFRGSTSRCACNRSRSGCCAARCQGEHVLLRSARCLLVERITRGRWGSKCWCTSTCWRLRCSESS